MASIILKATEKCNSNCYYCDVVRKKITGRSMDLNTLETVFIRVNEFLMSQPHEKMQIIWHGGEPLLLGPEYYSSAIKMQEKHCSKTKSRINHAIQTNLTCFNEEFVAVLKELGIPAIGTSYDPIPHMRGPGKEINSSIYNTKFMAALNILDKHDLNWGMIYIVTKKSLVKPLDIFFFLTNLTLTGGFYLNPVLIYDKKRKDIAITAEEFTDFLGTIFPFWWQYRERYPDVQPFRTLRENIIEGKRNLACVDSGDCTYHHLNISPDGETSQCGRSADWGLLNYGNIKDKSIYEILHDKQRDQFKERRELLPMTECKGCRFWELCHGGCPLDAHSLHKSFMHKSEWCDYKRLFISKYFEPITGARFEPKETTCS